MRDPLAYGTGSGPFVEKARQLLDENESVVRKGYATHIERHEKILDGLHLILEQHVWTFTMQGERTAVEKVRFAVAHKNLVALFGILENVLKGLVGSARLMFRQVFEAQILAKYISIRNDEELAQRWCNMESLSVPQVVLAKLHESQSQALGRFWKQMHVYVHHTAGSQQFPLCARENIDLVGHDLTVMGMLLHTQHHFTVRHAFSRTERYYAEYYDDERKISETKKELLELLSQDRKLHGPDARAFIRVFRGSWKNRDGSSMV